MAAFRSAEWVDELAARAATLEIDTGLSLILEHRIIGDPDATWHLDLGDGGIRVARGRHGAPTVVVTSSPAVAEAIQCGELSAQSAFLAGDLRIGGDISRLLELRDALDEVAKLLSATT